MKPIVITIANIPLSINYTDNQPIPPLFRKFETAQARRDHAWNLEVLNVNNNGERLHTNIFRDKIASVGQRLNLIDNSSVNREEKIRHLSGLFESYPKSSLKNISFYFSEPVEIKTKQRRMRYFYLDEKFSGVSSIFYGKFLTFAYSQILSAQEGILLHCTAVIKDKVAYLFFAHSGGGKSTIADLSKKYQVLGDDIIAIRKIKKDFLVYSTPWRQRKFIRPKSGLSAKVKAVFFLKKSNQLNFTPLKPEESLIRVLSRHIHFFLYTERPLVKKIFFTTANFFKTVPAYEMHFRKNDNFWPLLDKTVNTMKV